MAHKVLKLLVIFFLVPTWGVAPAANAADSPKKEGIQSLITETPEEGFQLALKLSRKGVTETQGDREVLHEGRADYAQSPDALIQASGVVAVHFQTVAEANNYWRD